jgi:hypothetical protein
MKKSGNSPLVAALVLLLIVSSSMFLSTQAKPTRDGSRHGSDDDVELCGIGLQFGDSGKKRSCCLYQSKLHPIHHATIHQMENQIESS